ncbi:piggyBac transposable element-derived protein 4-like [Prorops nasuta]|uniref:piggyBac transposable element-derived protein 4-like n=1 Tax=Prorops nasuta TaxID=863751 RepID=UPI0034CED8BB
MKRQKLKIYPSPKVTQRPSKVDVQRLTNRRVKGPKLLLRERVMNRNNPIISFLPGPIGVAQNAHSPLEVWSLLLTDQIINVIIVHTNEAIASYCEDNELECQNIHKDTDIIEFKAFIALLYMSGVQKNHNSNVEDLWSVEFGNILYRATMPLARYKFLYKCLQFDDRKTREARRENDKFAPIREIWERFISRCTALYNPASYCTIDEQLLSFRGRCPFKVYNGSKPDKYGIKIVMMNDSRTSYMYTAISYAGKVITENGEKVPSYYIRKLSSPIHGTRRNITCDNWFSSIPIFDKMLMDYNITMIGTIRKNKIEIPPDFKKSGEPSTCKYAFDATKTILAYTQKKNKVVLMLSTFHRTEGIDRDTNKPEMISFYNSTKSGTDTFDQMCHEYTTARKTRRWPVRVFFDVIS